MTILITVVVLMYAWQRFEVLRNFDDTTHQEIVETLSDPFEVFNQTDTQFNIAVGIKWATSIGVAAEGTQFDET